MTEDEFQVKLLREFARQRKEADAINPDLFAPIKVVAAAKAVYPTHTAALLTSVLETLTDGGSIRGVHGDQSVIFVEDTGIRTVEDESNLFTSTFRVTRRDGG